MADLLQCPTGRDRAVRKKAAPQDLWARAVNSLRAASAIAGDFPDKSGSAAYYAAMYALEALFLLEGKALGSHAAVRAALHRELIKTRRWDEEMGDIFDNLLGGRETGDYGGAAHVSPEEAGGLCEAARAILERVSGEHPDDFPLGLENDKAEE